MNGANRRWIGAHIYYHDRQDVLIDQGIRPLVEDHTLRDLVEGHFFVRHWQGGPHVRLRLLLRPGAPEPAVTDLLDERMEGFLHARPAETSVGQQEYLTVAGPLSRVEHGQNSIEPLRPNNSWCYRPYAPEYDRYGGTPEAMAVVERNFVESSEIGLDVIASGRSRDHRTTQALAMMVVSAAVWEGTPEGLVRFCSAGHLNWGRYLVLGDREGQQARFEQQYQRQHSSLRQLVSRLLAVVWGGGSGQDDTPISRWMRSVTVAKAELLRLHRAGLVAAPESMVAGDRDDQRGVGAILMFCSHMNNNRLGISLTEEAYLVYLLWRTVSDVVEVP